MGSFVSAAKNHWKTVVVLALITFLLFHQNGIRKDVQSLSEDINEIESDIKKLKSTIRPDKAETGFVAKARDPKKEALNRMLASDVSQQFLEYFSSRVEHRWDELSAFPDKKTDIAKESEHVFSTYSMLPDSRLQIHYEAPKASAPWDPAVCNTGLFRVKYLSPSGKVDFDGYIRAWKESTDLKSGSASPKLVRLQCEVSWPASLSYEDRRKMVMSLQVYKPGLLANETSAINSSPCLSVWAIEMTANGPGLYRYTLSDESTTFAFKEGDIRGMKGGQVDAFAVAPNGAMFFVNNDSSEPSGMLYRISRGSIDGKSSTDVHVAKVGPTGVSAASGKRLTALQFANNKIYGVGERSEVVYEINRTTGKATKVGGLGVGGSFTAGGMTVAPDKFVYITNALSSKSELWRFQKFPEGPIYKMDTIIKSGPIHSIAAHPNGWIFLYDGKTCFRYEPVTGLTQPYLNFAAGIKDMDFYYMHEYNDCETIRACETDGVLTGKIKLNPSGNTDFDFIMTLQSGAKITRDDLIKLGSKWEYIGKVYRIKFRPKTIGKQNVTLDADPFSVHNSIGYIVSSDVPFGVHVYNTKAPATAIGHWTIKLTDAPVHIDFCGDEKSKAGK